MDGDGYIMLAIIIVLAISTCVFAYLWHKEKNNNRFIPKDKEPKTKDARSGRKDEDEEEENEYEEEILSIIDEGHKQGAIEADEALMISNIFEFGDKEAKEIMRFRRKIVGIDMNTPLEEAVNFLLEQRYSRFPIYEEDIDNIVGIVHIKEVYKAYLENPELSLKDIAAEPVFIHQTKEVSDLFKEMQSEKIHMVIVIDEYGQTEGLVCMEDILEVIVGKIMDEYDVEEKDIINLAKEGDYLVQGMTRLDEIEELLGIEFPDEDVETLNGFLINKLGRLPDDNEDISVLYEGYEFMAVEIKEHIFQQIKIRIMES